MNDPYASVQVNTDSVTDRDVEHVSRSGVLTQAATLAKAVVRHVADGVRYVLPEVAQARYDICFPCSQISADKTRCKACTCILAIKTTWASEECPIGKWGRE
jgi:hypothetical protein